MIFVQSQIARLSLVRLSFLRYNGRTTIEPWGGVRDYRRPLRDTDVIPSVANLAQEQKQININFVHGSGADSFCSLVFVVSFITMAAPTSYEAMFAQMELIDKLAAATNATRAQVLQDQVASGIAMDEFLSMRLGEITSAQPTEATETGDASPTEAYNMGGTESVPPMVSTAAPSPPMDASTMMQKMMDMFWEVLSMKIAAPSASANSHLANARLDERCFRNVAKFTNNRSDWKSGPCIS